MGAPSFSQSIQTISTLFSIFSRDFPDGMIHRWTPEQFSNYPALNISNRYFYEPRDCHVQDSIALGETVDPDHYLTGLALQAGVIHTEDNRVVYMEKDKRTPDKCIHFTLTSNLFSHHNEILSTDSSRPIHRHSR